MSEPEPRDPFRASAPWSPDRPQTLVVCCSDGRFHAQLEEFVRHEVSERADLVALPGGPAVVDPWTSSFDESRVFDQAMRLFAAAHDLRAVWLIAHQGCAYYGVKHPGATSEALKAAQLADLAVARARILAAHPDHDVRCVFAALHGSAVVFEDVGAAAGVR
jgi:hypothetical protein